MQNVSMFPDLQSRFARISEEAHLSPVRTFPGLTRSAGATFGKYPSGKLELICGSSPKILFFVIFSFFDL